MMKRKLNFHVNKNQKQIIIVFVLSCFLIYISTFLGVFNRHYFFSEKIIKNASSMLNSYIIKNMYSKSKFNKDILSSKINYLQKENTGLRSMLNLEDESTNYLIAEVVNRINDTWLSKIDISKGYNDNIKKDYAVITSNGVIGFINVVSKNVSEVDLITDVSQKNMIPVSIETKDGYVSGVLSDYDPKKKLFKVTDVLSSNKIMKESKVLLSGYNNSTYKGLYVGKVVEEKMSNYGLNKIIWVKSDVDFDDILFVAVVKETK